MAEHAIDLATALMTGDAQSFPPRASAHRVAAVDLGSNSFHLVLGRISEGQIIVVDRMKKMVQLGAGLDEERRLSPAAEGRALACLERFGATVRGLRAESTERLLIVDIGGGSTEVVIGEGATPLDLESLYVGSIVLMKRHFDDGRIDAKRFRRAEVTTLQELERVQERFERLGWDSLRRVRDAVIEMGSVEALSFDGLS